MASLIEAVRTLTGDHTWFIKLVIAVCALHYGVQYASEYLDDPMTMLIFYVCLGLIFFGCGVSAMGRNINNKNKVLPGIMEIPDVIFKTAGGLISILLGCVSGAGLFYFISRLTLNDLSMYIIYAIALLLILPFTVVPMVLYSVKGRLKDAFRFDIINGAAGNFIPAFLWYLIQYALIFGVSSVVLYYFLVQMFSENHASITILYYTIGTASFYTTMIYFSDLYGDVIQQLDVNQKDEDSLQQLNQE